MTPKPRIIKRGPLWVCYTPASLGVLRYGTGLTPRDAFDAFHQCPQYLGHRDHG